MKLEFVVKLVEFCASVGWESAVVIGSDITER